MTYAEPDIEDRFAVDNPDRVARTRCLNCPDEVIRNYDGVGTGWSHIWPQDHPLYLRSGTKECR